MEVSISKKNKLFQLKPVLIEEGFISTTFTNGRVIVGRVESCDIVIPNITVSAVHAVIEITKDSMKIYDMNSTNGTFVNGKSLIQQEIKLGDKIKFADVEFIFEEYTLSSDLPPVLDSLEPEKGSASILPSAPIPKQSQYGASDVEKILPVAPDLEKEKDETPYIVYPLASDPKAEFSEYIFEDVDTLYPIFKYEIGRTSVEIIILFNDVVYSVDYLPYIKGQYHLVGEKPQKNDVEFAYLGKQDRIPFVEVANDSVHIHKLNGYEFFHLSDKEEKQNSEKAQSFILGHDDLVRFKKGELEIYVRNVGAPPKVAKAPFFRRDKDFKKYILMMFFMILLPLIGLQTFEVNEEIEKEKAPERIATILYKKKLVVSQNKAVENTKKALKKIQKTPQKKETPKKEQKAESKTSPQKNQESKKVVEKDPGQKDVKIVRDVKKGTKSPVKKAETLKSVQRANKPGVGALSSASRASNFKSPNKGHVETYRSADFKSTVSSLLAKGGAFKNTKSASGSGSSSLTGANVGGGSTGGLKSADIASPVGSLSGATTGRFDTSKGAEGLSNKRSIYTAGIPSETVILGSMDPDIIRQILKEHIPQFRYCYQKELESNSNISGVVRLDFIIGASGHVSRASVGGKGIPVDVRRCVGNVLRGIQFPSPKGGGQVEVKQPINFQAKKIN